MTHNNYQNYQHYQRYQRYQLVLASASPRRRELLSMLGLDFSICPTDADESLPSGMSPDAAVAELARRKAVAAGNICGDNALIIAADTMVSIDGRLLGKPSDEAEAIKMLSMLSGRSHTVYSGIALMAAGKVCSRTVATDVIFRELTDDEILHYVKSGEPFDKAGGYGIQGRAALFVRSIVGDYHNVVGLPICELEVMLRDEFSLSLSDFETEKV